MLGHGALGQIALGELRRRPVVYPPGSGAGHRFFRFDPEPAYDVKPRKPFRPIWDRGGKIETPVADVAPVPIPLPPASIFAGPPISNTAPLGLPDFNNLVPPDPVGLGRRALEARDMSDAMPIIEKLHQAQEVQDIADALRVLAALGLTKDS